MAQVGYEATVVQRDAGTAVAFDSQVLQRDCMDVMQDLTSQPRILIG
jgi:hypothetical protein